jgi:hypothetical protein
VQGFPEPPPYEPDWRLAYYGGGCPEGCDFGRDLYDMTKILIGTLNAGIAAALDSLAAAEE